VPAPTLVLSHPPHGGEVDLKLAAPVLGLAPADVRLKVNYPVPEIWAAESAPAAEAAAATLRLAGFRVVVVPGAALAAIPPRNPVVSFAFEDHGLLVRGAEQGTLGYDASVIAVLFSPRPGESKGGPAPAFLDLFTVVRGRLQRWTFLQGATGFGGMGTRQSASFGMNVHAFAADVGRRFAKCTTDERLVNLQVRRRVGAPPPGMVRRGFSYATTSLNELLESLAPGLSEIEHEDLASRLAFLTQAAGQAGRRADGQTG
jgi:hypothetical protein